MKYAFAAVLAAAAGAVAHPNNVTVVTEVVESYVTYCPSPTEIVHGSSTWTVTEPTTITITDCPCTITRPIYTTSSVVCNTCPGYTNSTGPAPTIPGAPIPTGGVTVTTEPGSPPTDVAPVPTAGAAKVASLSGLVGLAGLAAFFM